MNHSYSTYSNYPVHDTSSGFSQSLFPSHMIVTDRLSYPLPDLKGGLVVVEAQFLPDLRQGPGRAVVSEGLAN